MKKLILLFFFSAIAMMGAKAQIGGGYNFAMNFGGGGYEVSTTSVDASNNTYFTAQVAGVARFAGQNVGTTSTTNFPTLTNFIGKISADGTQTLIKTFGVYPAVKSVFSADGDFYGIFKGDKNYPVDLGVNVLLDDWGLYLIKINATGIVQFVKKITVGVGALQPYQPISVSGMQVAPDGNLYFGAQSLTYADSGSPYPSAKFPSLIAKYDANGNVVWSKTYYGDSRAFISMGQQFVSNAGKVSFGIRAQSGDPFYIDGVNITPEMSAFITQYSSDLSIVISLNANGTKNFGIADGVSPVGFVGVNPFTGNIAMQYSYLVQPGVFEQRLPSKAPFTSLPNQGIDPIKAFTGILTFNDAGTYLGYKSGLAISDNSLIATNNGFVNYLNYSQNSSIDLGNGYAFGDTKPFAVVSYYDQNLNFLKAVKSSKINSVGANGNVVSFGGIISTDYTFGNTTLIKNYNDPTFASNTSPYYTAYKNDLYIAQADASNIVAPMPVTWLGVDNNWDNIANWSNNKVADISTIVKFDANTAFMPITGTNPKALSVTIDAGVIAQLPANLSISGGKLIINGKLQINHTGALSFGGYSPGKMEGTGTIAFNGSSTPSVYSTGYYTGLTLETNEDMYFLYPPVLKKLKFTGTNSIIKLNGNNLEITSPDEDAISGYSETNFIEGGLTRTVNTSGTYIFPGRPLNLTYEPATLTLNNLQGITKIKAEFKGAVGAPNYKFPDGSICSNVLGSGSYGNSVKFSGNAVPTGGSYNITLQRSAFTNGVLDANKERYVVLKDYGFFGTKLASTQTGGTINGQVVSNALVTAGISGLSKFGEFLIGINSAIVPVGTAVTNATWTGSASGDWNTAGNWSSGVVPNGLTDVTIPVVTTVYPSIYSNTDFVNSLTINSGVINMSLSHVLGSNSGIINNGDIKIEKLTGTSTFYSGNIQGIGKTRFEANSGLTRVSMNTSNAIEVNIGNTNALEVTGSFSGNFNVKSGIITSQYSSNPFEITNPNAIIQITAPINGISTDQFIQTVNTTGTYFFPLISSFRNQTTTSIRNYGAATIKNNGIATATKYTVKFETAFKVPVSITDGSNFYNDFINSGQWYVTPAAVSATGTVDVSFTTSGYTNGGRTNLSDYALLRRASNSIYANGIPWVVVSGATITENAGAITATANGIPAFNSIGVTFCIGLKAGITTWTGAKDMNWNDAANWDKGLPSSELKAVIGNASRYPNNPPTSSTNQPGFIEIASGSVVSLPATFSAPSGIVNNGTIKVIGSNGSTFTGFLYNSSPVNISGSGKLVFDVNSPGTFDTYYMGYNIGNGIELNNPSGLALTRTTTFTGDVNLVNGKITMAANQLFNMSNPNASITGTANSYIIGQLNRKVNPSGIYNFPVGLAGTYAPASLNLNGLVGTTEITTNFSNEGISGQPNLTIASQTVNSLLSGGSWFINPNNQPTAGTYSVTLSAPIGSSTANNYYVLKRPGNYGTWTNRGTNVASSVTAGIVTASATGITSFSQFGLAEGFGALPVKLIKFLASADVKAAKLYWETASELNNDKFEIERSTNGKEFAKIGELKGNGTSQKLKTYNFKDYAPINGLNYYRLKQVDFNGDFEYSDVKAVKFDFEATVFSVYPNPVTEVINFSEAVKSVEIFNLQGARVFQQTTTASHVKIPSEMNNGVYIVKATLLDGSTVAKQLLVSK